MKWKNVLLATLLFALEVSMCVTAQKCNANGFYCPSSDKYQLCVDGGPPGMVVPCESGLACHMDCPIECTKSSCSPCNSNGYSCASHNEFIICRDSTNIPNPGDKRDCPPRMVCCRNCNAPTVCTDNMCPVTCTSTTRLPVEGNTTIYYLCEVDPVTSEVTVTTHACPPGTEYNTVEKTCSTTTTISTTSTTASTTVSTTAPTTVPTTAPTTPTTAPTTVSTATPPAETTTHAPHVCKQAGRFPDPNNCTRYHLCIADGQSLVKATYDCPSGFYFNPNTLKCGADSSACVAPKTLALRSPESSVCLSDRERYEDSSSCNHYFICSWSDDELIPYRHTCPKGSIFNPDKARCTSSNNYYCDK